MSGFTELNFTYGKGPDPLTVHNVALGLTAYHCKHLHIMSFPAFTRQGDF